MRTRLMRGKFTLLFLTLAMLLAVPAVAYAADQLIVDGDFITPGDQTTRNLGTVNPGAIAPTGPVTWSLDCQGNNHFNSTETADLTVTATSIKDAGGLTPSTGSVNASSLTNISGPTTVGGTPYPNDGSNACPAANAPLPASNVTIVAPKKAGTYTYTVTYHLNRDAGATPETTTATNELALAQGGGGPAADNVTLTYTLTVPNAAPQINAFNGDTTATEGNTKPYSINASDANEDTLTYGLTKASGTANVNITPGVGSGNFNVQFLTVGSVVLRASASDGTNPAVTQDKTVTVASACTVPSVTTQPQDQTIAHGNNATFTAAASGTSPTVQWQKSNDGTNWTNVSGATNTSLTLTNPSVSDSTSKYRAVFTNGCGSATSNPATLTVNQATAQVTLNSADLNQTYDGNVKSVGTSTTPTGLNVNVTYDGSATAPTNAGSYDVVATVTDPNYQGSASGKLTIEQASQTITGFAAIANKTFGDDDFQVSATGGGSGEPVTFAAEGNCSIVSGANNTFVHLTGAGNCTVTASQAGNNNYSAATDVAHTFSIEKATTTTTITCGAGPFTYDGSAHTPCSAKVTGFGLDQLVAVDYTNNTGAGQATASASYAGDTNYKPSSSDSKTFTIDKASSTTEVTCTGGPFTYTGSAHTPCSAKATGAGGLSENLTVDYQNNVGAGTATASASFAGDANHTGSDGEANFTIDKASSTTTVDCPANVTYDGTAKTPCTAKVTGPGGLSENLAVNYADNTNAGQATASASFAGDANHEGSQASKTFTIDKASQSINFGTLSDKKLGAADFNVNATGGGSGNPVTFAAAPNATCTITGNTVRITGVGTCTITASQAGNNNYLAATDVSRSFKVTYNFDGFRSPVDNPGTGATPVFNSAKAGQSIPVKFSLGGNQGLDIISAGYPKVTSVNCTSSATVDPLEEYAATTTNGGLNYDATANQYNYVWKTQSTYANKCFKFDLTLKDGTSHVAYFKFLK